MSVLFLLNLTQDLVAEFLDGGRQFLPGSLSRVILHPHGFVVKGYLQVLDTLLKRDVLLNFLNTVLTVKVDREDDFLQRSLLFLGVRSYGKNDNINTATAVFIKNLNVFIFFKIYKFGKIYFQRVNLTPA